MVSQQSQELPANFSEKVHSECVLFAVFKELRIDLVQCELPFFFFKSLTRQGGRGSFMSYLPAREKKQNSETSDDV